MKTWFTWPGFSPCITDSLYRNTQANDGLPTQRVGNTNSIIFVSLKSFVQIVESVVKWGTCRLMWRHFNTWSTIAWLKAFFTYANIDIPLCLQEKNIHFVHFPPPSETWYSNYILLLTPIVSFFNGFGYPWGHYLVLYDRWSIQARLKSQKHFMFWESHALYIKSFIFLKRSTVLENVFSFYAIIHLFYYGNLVDGCLTVVHILNKTHL